MSAWENMVKKKYEEDQYVERSIRNNINAGNDVNLADDEPEWKKKAVQEYKDNVSVTINDDNGNPIGTVGYEALKAIRKNTRSSISGYKPKNDEEKRVFEYLKDRQNIRARKNYKAKKEPSGRDATFWDLTINSLKRGYVQSLYGQESYKAMTGQKNNKAYYEEKLKSEDYSFIPDAWYEKALSGAMELLGQQFKQWTDPRSVAAGTAAASAVALAGQAGPQIAAPEEIITVPSAFFAGIAAGSTTSNFEIEAGLAYNEMVENGISPDTASKIALGVGTGNAALEMIQFDDLAKSLKILNASDATQPVAKKIASYLKNRGVSVVSETAQEVGQEAVTIAGVNIGSKVDKGEWAYDWGEIGQRIGETAASSAMSFGLLGTGGDAINYGVNKTSNAIENKQSTVKIGKMIRNTDAVQSIVDTGLESPKDSTAYKLAEQAQQKLNKKGKLSDYEVGKLYYANVEQIKQKEQTAKETSKPEMKTNSAEETSTTVVENTTAKTPGKTEQRNTFTDELDEIANTEMPTVSVGETFIESGSNKIIKVIDRGDTHATVEITTPNGVKETKQLRLAAVDNMAVDDKYTKVETSVDTSAAVTENADVVSPEDAQRYNIVVSNLKRKAEELGLLDSNFFTALQNVNLYNPSANDRALISSEFHRVFADNTDPLVTNWLDSISEDTQPVTTTNLESVHVNTENTSVAEVDSSDVEVAVVVDAINETLVPGAKENLLKALAEGGRRADVITLAKSLRKAYKNAGTLGKMAEFFTDNGKKVIAAIESTIHTENVTTAEAQAVTNVNEENVQVTDKSHTVAYTNDNEKIDLKFKIVSIDDIIASNEPDGRVNPDYPQELQPRDRSRDASQIQITQMANNLNPARLAESTSVSEGAPIVGTDNVVESGNGRTLAIKLAYETGTADAYKNYIISNADNFGIDISNIPANPILVRERLTEVDRIEFTRKANESSVGSLSATEQAKVDAENLTGDILNLLIANDNGIINTSENKNFISAVITKVFKSEDLNNVVNADGMLSARGLERIKNAIFYKAYGDASLSARLSESLDNDMKNATNVLLNIAPKVVYIKNGIASGNLYDFDFSSDIAGAVRLFEKCRNTNTTISNYAAQTTMFEKESPLVMEMTYVFETKNRGAKQATDFYNLILDRVINLGNPNQISLGITEVFETKEAVFNEAREQYNTRVEPKNTIAIPESLSGPESISGRDDDGRGRNEVSWNNTSSGQESETAIGVQRNNGPGKETGVIANDEQLRQTKESVERQPEVGEVEQKKKTEKKIVEESVENGTIGEYDTGREDFIKDDGEKRSSGERDRGGNIASSTDSEGRAGRTYPIDSRKNGSKKAKKGRIKGVYHGSTYQFNSFEKSYVDIGIHFGTKEQAEARIDGSEGNVSEYDLILNNPLSCEDLFGERTPDEYLNDLIEGSALKENEKSELRETYKNYKQGDIKSEAKESLKEKIASGKYGIETEIDNDGIFVNISLKDDLGRINQIPMTELIGVNVLKDAFGEKTTEALLQSKEVSELTKRQLSLVAFEFATNLEMNYLRLRKIEDILKSFGYDGFAYQNENEGDGWSYAVFDDEQVIRLNSESDTIEEKSAMQNLDVVENSYDVSSLEKVCSDIRKGESVSLETMRTAVDAILFNHGESIKVELSQLKNDELKKQLSIYDRGRVTKKAEMVDSIYTDMLSSLYYALSGKDTITYIYDGTGFEAQQSKMLFDISRELTEETFSKRLAENAEKYKKQLAAREEKLAKVKNPQTLEDYAYKKRYFGLSNEETIQYENLYAEERRKAREDKKTAKTAKDTRGADAFFANADNYTIEKTTHTKTGEDVWVVRPVNRLETEEWKQLNEQMKALGGSYWRGNQGWNFKKDPTAALTSTEEAETETAKGSTNAEKLRVVAEGMQKTIDDKFRDRLTNTAKRAREAASAEAEGERLKRLQDTINNIADALENGENTLLDKIDSKAQVETLMSMLRTGRRNRISETLPDITYDERLQEQDKPYSNDDAKYAEYPLTKLHESAITEYIRAAEGKTGYKQITDRLKKSLKSVKNGYVTVDAQMYADVNKIVQNLSTYRADFWNDGVSERKRLARMGIENVVELRAYLREFIKFLPGKDADAERQRSIKAKERQLANAKIEGFFPTPKAIVDKMLDEADIQPSEKVLEPSAGKGNIADAIRENYLDNALDVVEWNASLNELLSEKGHNVVGVDFLQHSGEYDKIIMNPPFEKGQDIDHIKHAYSLLNDGGRVVCIMSEGPFYRSDKKATEFREWLDEVGGVSEKLPDGSFKTAERSTGVNTRLVVIDKTTPMKDSVLYEGQPLYSLEREGNNNGEVREDLLSGNGRRGSDESARKQTERLSAFKQRNRGRDGKERKSFARQLREQGQTEEVIDGTDKYTLVKPEAYNDDMLSMVEEAKSKGLEVGFFVGNAKIKFDTKDEFKVDGIKVSGSRVLVQYDGIRTPQSILKHEGIHSKWNTPEMQKVKDTILNRLSKTDKESILSQDRYKRYKKIYKGNMDNVWEEFVADVMSGMNEYTPTFIDTVADYWYGDESIDRYSPADYTNSIDAGGNQAILDNVGIGDEYRLSESGVEYENTNAIGVEEKGTYQNNDSIWQRSDDSEGLYRSVGNGKTLLRGSEENGVGLIDWSRKFGTLDVNDTKEKGRAYGFLRKISELKIADEDSLGRKLPKGVKDYFGQTVLKNSRGEIVPLYHATDEKFDIFNYGDFGFHIGNWEQATYLNKKFIKEVYVDVKNPMYISDDSMHWYGMVIASRALSQDIINRNEYDSISKLDGFFGMDYNSEANTALRELLKEKGYDGIIYNNGFEGKDISVMVFDSSQIKYTSNQNPTNSPNTRYSLEGDDIPDFLELWDEYIDKYGTIPKGEKPARDVDVPKKVSEKDVVSRFARTMLEAGVTPDWAVSEFEKAIVDGEMTHEVITNKKARAKAIRQIEYLGFEEALNRWTVLSESGKVGKDELALGMELYNQCVTNKDVHNAMKIAAELAAEATRAGQTLQACRMLKLMTPDGQLYYLEKSIQKMNEEFREKLKDKYKDIEIDEGLTEEFISEKDEEKRNAVYDKICQNIADQIPATLLDKWNSWRYLAMLGNPRTHIRNIIGNAVFVPSVRIKNYVGAAIEKISKVDTAERTKSFRKSKEAVAFAENDFEEMSKTLQGENAKYAVTSDIEGKRTIFKTKWLEKLRLKNFDFLEREDMWFLKMHYTDALARLITVRNIDINSLDTKTLETLRAYAVKEAQAATYRDANSLAEGLNKLQRKLERSDKKVIRASGILLEGAMPFKKTPMNIAKQGINYSPLGILKGTYTALAKVKKEEASITDVIDDFSKGLTGTGVMLLGLFLANIGVLIGAGDKPDKEKEFDKMVGEQDYAIKIGDVFSYTIDWMTPSNLSLFIGAKLYDLTKDDFEFADVVGALSTVTEPLLELSVFSGVNGVIESAQYSDSEALLAIGSDMITSYLMQALPTIGGQISRIVDESKREYYYVDKNKDVPKGLQRLIGQASSKIPFASYLFEPAIDEWGREETYGNLFERTLENALSPGYYAEDNYTEVDKELREIYERTGETSVLPVIQQKYYKEDKIYYYMSAEDYTEAKKMRGQKSFEYVNKLINSSKYRSMSDEEKVSAIEKCYKRAGEETKGIMLEKVKQNAGKR